MEFLHQTLASFNRGDLDPDTAAQLLSVSRAHLFRLRAAWLRKPDAFTLHLSGGNHRSAWQPSCRSNARRHFPLLISAPAPTLKPRRRWERARLGELWQHDSSIHQWWPADDKQTLLLTVDDHSRKLLTAVFVPTDTTWHHFQHFRRAFTLHGLPVVLYTDGVALFGHESTRDNRDPRSEFQRALTALGVSHLVAPSPQAKGKIERRFGTFQNHIVTLLAYEKITDYSSAQELLARELTRQNRTICRTTGLSPDDACAKAQEEKTHRPAALS